METERKEIKNEIKVISGKFDKDTLKKILEYNIKNYEAICFICNNENTASILSKSVIDIANDINYKYGIVQSKNITSSDNIYFVVTKMDGMFILNTTQNSAYLVKSKYIAKVNLENKKEDIKND